MLHVVAILVLTGFHTHAATVVAGFGRRPLREYELGAEVRIAALVEGTERDEGLTEHGVAEALVTMEHLAHIVGG